MPSLADLAPTLQHLLTAEADRAAHETHSAVKGASPHRHTSCQDRVYRADDRPPVPCPNVYERDALSTEAAFSVVPETPLRVENRLVRGVASP